MHQVSVWGKTVDCGVPISVSDIDFTVASYGYVVWVTEWSLHCRPLGVTKRQQDFALECELQHPMAISIYYVELVALRNVNTVGILDEALSERLKKRAVAGKH
jgi:hypothetical protein